jgi:hypothetical protein
VERQQPVLKYSNASQNQIFQTNMCQNNNYANDVPKCHDNNIVYKEGDHKANTVKSDYSPTLYNNINNNSKLQFNKFYKTYQKLKVSKNQNLCSIFKSNSALDSQRVRVTETPQKEHSSTHKNNNATTTQSHVNNTKKHTMSYCKYLNFKSPRFFKYSPAPSRSILYCNSMPSYQSTHHIKSPLSNTEPFKRNSTYNSYSYNNYKQPYCYQDHHNI